LLQCSLNLGSGSIRFMINDRRLSLKSFAAFA
jgi:hypothetical protein